MPRRGFGCDPRPWPGTFSSDFVQFRPIFPCSSAEVFIQGGPCDTTATSPAADSTPPPGVVEPTVPHKLPTGDGLPAPGTIVSRTSTRRGTSRIAPATNREARASTALAGPPRAGDQVPDHPRHPRGERERRQVRSPRAGNPGVALLHHPRGREGCGVAVPSAEALRPYARALVALALEVRAESLALPAGKRSHGPIGRGGGRCPV